MRCKYGWQIGERQMRGKVLVCKGTCQRGSDSGWVFIPLFARAR